jgi:hypothetical protein
MPQIILQKVIAGSVPFACKKCQGGFGGSIVLTNASMWRQLFR